MLDHSVYAGGAPGTYGRLCTLTGTNLVFNVDLDSVSSLAPGAIVDVILTLSDNETDADHCAAASAPIV